MPRSTWCLIATGLLAGCDSATDAVAPGSTAAGASTLSLAAAPTIGLRPTRFHLCYPGGGSTRACGPGGKLLISNVGGGTLNWTATKTGTWLRISPKTGAAPSTVKVWVDVTSLTRGHTYVARVTVSATGATNGSQTIPVYMTMR